MSRHSPERKKISQPELNSPDSLANAIAINPWHWYILILFEEIGVRLKRLKWTKQTELRGRTRKLHQAVQRYVLSTFNFIQSFTHIIYNIHDSFHPRIEERNRGEGRDTNLKKGKEKSTGCALFTFQVNILCNFFNRPKRNARQGKWSDIMGSDIDKIAWMFQKSIWLTG